MLQLLKNRYFQGYLLLYIITSFLLNYFEGYPIGEVIAILVILGVIFTSVAWIVTKGIKPGSEDRPRQKSELQILIGLAVYLVLFLTYYKSFANRIVVLLDGNEQFSELLVGAVKLFFLVILPLLVYKLKYNFTLSDWGIQLSVKDCFSSRYLFVFFVFVAIIIPFQYFAGNGARPIRDGMLGTQQLLLGIPLSYIWLVLTVGIVEEYFFRVFLQSRISTIINSNIGGIVISAIIFGLAHAPGIYLRGGGVIANLGTDPSLLLSIGYSILVLSVAGIFLSVIWLRTRNFWLIVAIHALVDLMPGLWDFVNLWGIK